MEGWMIYLLLLVGLTQVIVTSGQVEVRLADGLNEREGRVEVFYNGTWGTICDDDWDVFDAAVICRMLGYVGVARAHLKAQPFGEGVGRVWMDSVTCSGDESSIAECQQLGWGVTDCQHDEDAGVTCLGERVGTTPTPMPTRTPSTTTLPPRICDSPSPDIRLLGGPSEAEGRVQVRRNGVWGDVCDDRWGLEDARVICRMLCYNPENARAHLGGKYGNASSEYLLDEVQCLGTEVTILDCPKNPWGVNNCRPQEAAGVSCLQEDPGLPRLPDPEIICENSIIQVIFDRNLETRLEPKFLSLVSAPQNCDYESKININFVIMEIPFIGCGTVRRDNETHILYENNVRHAVPPPSDVVTRSTIYYIPVVCVMPRAGDPENNIQPEARTAPPQRGKGAFDVQMFFYLNNRFVDPVQRFPARVVLGEAVYVAMSLKSVDRNLKLIIPICWATPEKESDSTPRVDLIKDKCINENSVIFYPINDTAFAFRFTSFKFLGDYPYTYIHCDGYVCGLDEKTPECDRSCGTGVSSRRRRQAGDDRSFYDVNQGPIAFLETGEDAGLQKNLLEEHHNTETKALSISGSETLHHCLIGTLLSLAAILFVL